MKIRRILCPTDFSEFSRRALEHATALARTHGAELAVLHVSPFMVVMAGDVPYFPAGLPLDAAARARSWSISWSARPSERRSHALS